MPGHYGCAQRCQGCQLRRCSIPSEHPAHHFRNNHYCWDCWIQYAQGRIPQCRCIICSPPPNGANGDSDDPPKKTAFGTRSCVHSLRIDEAMQALGDEDPEQLVKKHRDSPLDEVTTVVALPGAPRPPPVPQESAAPRPPAPQETVPLLGLPPLDPRNTASVDLSGVSADLIRSCIRRLTDELSRREQSWSS